MEGKTIKKIEALLNNLKVKYKIILPLDDFQRQYFEFKKQKAPNLFALYLYYLVFEGSFSDFLQSVKKSLGKEFQDRIVMQEVC